MCQVELTVELNGKKYLTNVIVQKGMSNETIEYLAKKQVINQWNK